MNCKKLTQMSKHVNDSLTKNEIEEWAVGQHEIYCDIILTDAIQEVGGLVLVKHGEAVLAFNRCIAWPNLL